MNLRSAALARAEPPRALAGSWARALLLHPLAALSLGVSVALFWILPVVPGQDLPQHLANARIFADLASPSLPFHEYYAPPAHITPYDTPYLALAAIARASSMATASRIVATAFAVGTFYAFQRLVDALHARGPDGAPPATTALATLVVFGPVVMMGFLQFYLAIPLILFVVAELARDDRRASLGAAAAAAVVASIHPAAAGALCVVLLLHAALDRDEGARRRRVRLLFVFLAIAGVTIAWRIGGEAVGMRAQAVDWRGSFRDAQGLELVDAAFGITWYDPPVTTSFVAWTVLGPYRLSGLLPPLIVSAWLAGVVVQRRHELSLSAAARRHARVAVAFGIVACLLPWGIARPEELTYLNFRVIGVAAALALALVPPASFRAGAGRWAIRAFTIVTLVNLSANMAGFAREARAPLALLEKVDRREVLLPLVFEGTSLRFAKAFRLTHHLPTLFTAEGGGITTQFWARYTPHLPFDYLPGKRPAQPPDWLPARFDPDLHLRDVDAVLLELADDDVSPDRREEAARAQRELETRADLVAMDGRWRLYRVRRRRDVEPIHDE